MEPALRLRLRLPTSPKWIGRSRKAVTVAMAENSPGRSVPRRGGAVTVVVVRVWRLRFVFGGRGIVMMAGLMGKVEGEGEGRVCERKSESCIWRGPEGGSAGSVV